MEPRERVKKFTENKTSVIDYPKGIAEIERFLMQIKLDKEPVNHIT
jgi:hypothetical protein